LAARHRDHSVAAGHSTMLVHVTRWTDVHGVVARQIENQCALATFSSLII